MISTIVVPLIVLGVLIVVHEFGHFIIAKWCGVGVVKFSVGFGPAIWKKRIGETIYQVSVIPLGGFVRMLGDMPDMITGEQATDSAVRDEDEEQAEGEEASSIYVDEEWSEADRAFFEDRSRWFLEKGLAARSAIVAAGPVFNFLLAIVLIFGSVILYGEEYVEEDPTIGTVMQGSPAGAGGLQEGDLVRTIDGAVVADWKTLAKTIREGSGDEIVLGVVRGGADLELRIRPEAKEIRTPSGEYERVHMIGIGPEYGTREVGVWRAAEVGLLWTLRATERTVEGLWGLITGHVSPKELAGPLFILGEANRQAKRGLQDLLSFMAVLSVSLAVLNLLPIPVLDGGHLLFFLIEALLGPISIRKREVAQQVGMLLLLCLMVFAIHNDISRDTSELEPKVEWESQKTPAKSPAETAGQEAVTGQSSK